MSGAGRAGLSSDPAELRAAAVALARTVGLDAPRLADRLERDDPRIALAEALGTGHSLLPTDPTPLTVRASQDLASWDHRGLHCLTVADDAYPGRLHTVHDRPALLWVMGDLALLGRAPAIAVVGTRRPTEDGRAQATAIASELAAAGVTVLSGLAAGIDAIAHRAALAAGGRTIGVIGTGLEHTYPPQNTALQVELARDHAVVSAFWPEDGPSVDRFRRRNAVMSGLSDGTVIVEASVRSGTRVQARRALAHGRPVFLRRALLVQSWAAELSQRAGVHVIDDAADVLRITRRNLDPGPITDAASSVDIDPRPRT